MKDRGWMRVGGVGVVALLSLVVGVAGAQAQAPEVPVPEPGVPEIFTLQGEFVRVAYNNEGYASLGYRVANSSQGEEWMLLEVGVTIRSGVKDYKLPRTALTLDTPSHRGLPPTTGSRSGRCSSSGQRHGGSPGRLPGWGCTRPRGGC